MFTSRENPGVSKSAAKSGIRESRIVICAPSNVWTQNFATPDTPIPNQPIPVHKHKEMVEKDSAHCIVAQGGVEILQCVKHLGQWYHFVH